MERKWIVCAFGDLRGFGIWTSRAASSREVKDPFVFKFYETLQLYVRKHPDVYFKYTGDGFMAVKEFEHTDAGGIYQFIRTLKCVTRKVRQDVSDCAWPAPDGFRIRITSGDVYKLMVLDPSDPARFRLIPEYVEYPPNTAAHLLRVNPEIVAVATEGTVKSLGKYQSAFRPRRLEKASCYPLSVNREDIDGLYILKF